MLKHYDSLGNDHPGGPIVVLNLIGANRGLEKTLYEKQNSIMEETELFSKHLVEYYHFDFHSECHENSDPMLDYLKQMILPAHMNQIGMFVQRNDILQGAQGRRLESHVE